MENLIYEFNKQYSEGGTIHSYFAPGRVNLIGEHTDYNGGHVFPCALTIGTYGLVRKRADRNIRFYSLNFTEKGVINTSLDDLVMSQEAGWTNYPKGVMWAYKQRGYIMDCGLDILIYGNIPNGSGLSSSASLEVLMGLIIKDLYRFPVSMEDIALIGQYSENKFNGCNCGIMDQFASAMGKKDHAIFLDTNNLKYQYVPVKLKGEKIIIVNSKVKHSLVDSAYNNRRNECEEALKKLQTVIDIKTLGDLSIEQYEQYKSVIANPINEKRAKHAVYENQRTIQACKVLIDGNISAFGKLMNESHISLRDDYEVSCEEIDTLVDLALDMKGVYGARITGGGFGGCTVNIVDESFIDEFIYKTTQGYKEKTGIEPELYIVDIGDGAHCLER